MDVNKKIIKIIGQLETIYVELYSSFKVDDFYDKKEIVIEKKSELKRLERILKYLYLEGAVVNAKESEQIEEKIYTLKKEGKGRAKNILLKIQ
ncbi:hypothetical protein PRVXT_001000 [Proteinivorax tanatarense]|uniref:Uncharacterized protein n=1 Tax=Proteinivorax tanatarense TaxID=1260629 RepID=A0AAU7VPN3_9FIRM